MMPCYQALDIRLIGTDMAMTRRYITLTSNDKAMWITSRFDLQLGG